MRQGRFTLCIVTMASKSSVSYPNRAKPSAAVEGEEEEGEEGGGGGGAEAEAAAAAVEAEWLLKTLA